MTAWRTWFFGSKSGLLSSVSSPPLHPLLPCDRTCGPHVRRRILGTTELSVLGLGPGVFVPCRRWNAALYEPLGISSADFGTLGIGPRLQHDCADRNGRHGTRRRLGDCKLGLLGVTEIRSPERAASVTWTSSHCYCTRATTLLPSCYLSVLSTLR